MTQKLSISQKNNEIYPHKELYWNSITMATFIG